MRLIHATAAVLFLGAAAAAIVAGGRIADHGTKIAISSEDIPSLDALGDAPTGDGSAETGEPVAETNQQPAAAVKEGSGQQPGEAAATPPSQQSGQPETSPPSRSIDPMTAPPPSDTGALQRIEPRAPLSKLSHALLGLAETGGCRRQVLLSYFGDHGEPCGNCDTCAEPPKLFDGAIAAQKALSCIYRTGERFGQAYVVDVLLGVDNERITQFGHDRISTYGIGREHDNRTWRAILRQLIALRLIDVDLTGHGGLAIAPAGRDFLRDKPPLMLRIPAPARARRGKVARSAAQSAVAGADNDLFQALRQKRTEIARLQNVPPYVIFHDKTLIELAAVRPASRAEMAGVPGVGEAKLDRYGPAFLAVIAEHA